MSSEYKGSASDPNQIQRHPTSELWGGPWEQPDEDTHPHAAVSPPEQERKQGQLGQAGQFGLSGQPGQSGQPSQIPNANNPPADFSHREHGTGALPMPSAHPPYLPYPPYAPQGNGYIPPMSGPPMQPTGVPPSMPYGGQQGQQGQYPAPAYPQYRGHPGYAYPSYPAYQAYPTYPGYPPQPYAYAPYPAYPGYPPGYPGYPGYSAYPAYPPRKPKRDGYLLAMNIVSVVGVSIVLLGGLGLLLITLIIAIAPMNPAESPGQYFDLMLQLIAFTSAGIIGGGFGLYHCIRSFIRRPSADLRLPWFWIFLLLYGVVIAISFGLQSSGNAVTFFALSAFLIALAAIFPALTLLALGVRRLRFPAWPTTWRRFALALTSGATSGIGIALALELLAAYLLVIGLQANNALNCVNDPSTPDCGTMASFNITFLFIAVIGPVIEETVKPLAIIPFIGRIRSASEAFVLGMACGIGFALIETVGYIGLGYQDWLTVALERSGASLLHGFGAGMVALGWYYLFHAKKYRFLKAIGCYAYAVFQHFTWNATAALALLPGPAGATINSWNLNLGFIVLPFVEILNILEVILMLVFFIYITGRIRATATPPPEPRNVEPSGNMPALART